MAKEPVMLMILDGWGLGRKYKGNAVELADTPNYDRLIKNNSNTRLKASGESVGLPAGQMGNSEVGHLNIGSGRIVYQELTRIGKSIEEGDFFNKREFLDAIDNCKNNATKLHLIGLVSNGGVHSHNSHLYALLELCKREDFDRVFIHAILDGRDVPPTIAREQVGELEEKIEEIGVGRIASISGRYYAMDRDRRWERTKLAYDAIVDGVGKTGLNSDDIISHSYEEGINDEFVIPTVIVDDDKPIASVENGDSIIFFNFRPDRARQLTRAIVDKDFDGFEREKSLHTYFVTMTEYDDSIKNVKVAFKPSKLKNTLGEYISSLGYSQLRIAETEKYAHVTFFFNGGEEQAYENEDRILIPSPKVATYDLQPEMSANKLKDEVIKSLGEDKYDLIILNFANPDMVGHTGVVEAAIKAIEEVDRCMGEILEYIDSKKGRVLITADHGNSEELINERDDSPITSHTTNEVPLILYGDDRELRTGILADIAPTILELMNIEKPEEMTGKSLIINK